MYTVDVNNISRNLIAGNFADWDINVEALHTDCVCYLPLKIEMQSSNPMFVRTI